MITSKYEWQFATPFSDDTFLAQAKKRGLEASAAKLLGERGIQKNKKQLSSKKIVKKQHAVVYHTNQSKKLRFPGVFLCSYRSFNILVARSSISTAFW